MSLCVSVNDCRNVGEEDPDKKTKGEWEAVQTKTFTNWINNKIKPVRDTPITDLFKDISDGVILIQLLEILGGTKFPKYKLNPKLRIHKVENVNRALEYVKSRNVSLTNIGSGDIVDQNNKLILGLIWTIILRFTIQNIKVKGVDTVAPKEALLLWCKEQASAYKDDFVITDFSYSWKNGLAFCALIHEYDKSLLDYHNLDKTDSRTNMALAFDTAERKLNIPKLLDPSDVIDVDKPDERSIITYISQYYHEFNAKEKAPEPKSTSDEEIKKAGKDISRFLHDLKKCKELNYKYESICEELNRDIESKVKQLDDMDPKDYESNVECINKMSSVPPDYLEVWDSKKMELESILNSMNSKREENNLELYIPNDESTVKSIRNNISRAQRRRIECYDKYLCYIANYQKKLHEDFIKQLKYIHRLLTSTSDILETYYDPEVNQNDVINNCAENLETASNNFDELKRLETRSVNIGLYMSPGIPLNITVWLAHEYNGLLKELKEKRKFLICSGSLPPEEIQLSRYRHGDLSKTFNDADQDENLTLNREEFERALVLRGLLLDEKKLDQIYKDFGNGEEIDYKAFVEIITQQDLEMSPAILHSLFETIAGGKPTVNDEDLRAAGLDENIIQSIRDNLSEKEQSEHNYSEFVQKFS